MESRTDGGRTDTLQPRIVKTRSTVVAPTTHDPLLDHDDLPIRKVIVPLVVRS